MQSQKYISDFLKSLRPERTKIQKIILFGSAARADFDETSDLDVIIIEETDERFVVRNQKYYRQMRVPCAVDLLVYTPEEFKRMKAEGNSLIRRVVREGRVLYEKKLKTRSKTLAKTS
jgi:predicted nucleotidyltransferase